jgi:hypothetical protein
MRRFLADVLHLLVLPTTASVDGRATRTTKGLRRFACVALLLATLPFEGCQALSFTISIPDFTSKRVSGVWLWRWSTTNRVFQRDGQFLFGQPDPSPGGETLDYTLLPAGGGQALPFTAAVVREVANPDHVTLHLILSRTDSAGYYRASTFNAAGESPLSVEVLPL